MTESRRVRHLLIGALLLGSSAAAAQPAPSDCESIRNDLAYNRCLASFGPKRGERTARDSADEADAPAARATGRRAPVLRRDGRQAASFDVVSGRTARGARPVR